MHGWSATKGLYPDLSKHQQTLGHAYTGIQLFNDTTVFREYSLEKLEQFKSLEE